MSCLLCTHWKPKEAGNGAMAKQGYAICALGPRWEFHAKQDTCAKHQPAPAEIRAAREKWDSR